MRVLVIGGTGTVGSQLVARLAGKNCDVRVMTRSPERGGNGRPGAEYVFGDLTEPDSLGPVFDGVDRVYLLTPLHPDEVELGRAAVRAAAEAGVERLVFQSVHNVRSMPEPPHFRSKIEIEDAIRESGTRWTFICPNSFYQNDCHFREALLQHGVYPQPLGNTGANRVDVRDIADAAVTVLLDSGHEGETYPLVGPDALTGEETARIWGRHLGREIRYGGDALDAWSAQARKILPDWMVEDLAVMYAMFQERGLVASKEDLDLTRKVVKHEPRSFESFAAETAAAWR